MTGLHRQVLGHLARRGADFAANGRHSAYVQSLEAKAADGGDLPFGISSGVFAFLLVTFLAFVFVYASLKYTLGEVVSSLVMIESPSTVVVAAYQPASYRDNDTDDLATKGVVLDEEVTLMKEKPITSSIRETIRHLGRVGGFKARWRGFGIALAYSLLQGLAWVAFEALFSIIPILSMFSYFLASIAATICLARVHMTWTHIMISAPSPLRWYRRIPKGRTYFKVLAIPAAICAICQHLTFVLPLMVHSWFGPFPDIVSGGVPPTGEVPPNQARTECLRVFATLATAAFVALALLVPATVTLKRVEASLLPDDAETIVNFDRTLGGAAVNLVGLGKLNLRALYDAAWRSFDKSSRIRLIKFYAKYFAIMLLVDFVFAAFFAVQIFILGRQGLMLFFESAGAKMQSMEMQNAGMIEN